MTDSFTLIIAALVVLGVLGVLWRYLQHRRALLAQMQEITQSHITVVSLPKTSSEEAFVIKEGDKDKMQTGVEYAYFYGSGDKTLSQSQRYHTITIFSLEKLQKPVLKSMTDDDVITKLQEEGWQQTGSQSFGIDDVITYYFQRSI
jgi:hypothetical protein